MPVYIRYRIYNYDFAFPDINCVKAEPKDQDTDAGTGDSGQAGKGIGEDRFEMTAWIDRRSYKEGYDI